MLWMGAVEGRSALKGCRRAEHWRGDERRKRWGEREEREKTNPFLEVFTQNSSRVVVRQLIVALYRQHRRQFYVLFVERKRRETHLVATNRKTLPLLL